MCQVLLIMIETLLPVMIGLIKEPDKCHVQNCIIFFKSNSCTVIHLKGYEGDCKS